MTMAYEERSGPQHDQLPSPDEILLRGRYNRRIVTRRILVACIILLSVVTVFVVGFEFGTKDRNQSSLGGGGTEDDTPKTNTMNDDQSDSGGGGTDDGTPITTIINDDQSDSGGGGTEDDTPSTSTINDENATTAESNDSSPVIITLNDLITKGIIGQNDVEVFSNESSYQSRALKVLTENGENKNYSRQKLAQRYALLCLYYSTYRVRTDVTDTQYGYGTTPGWYVLSPWKSAWGDDECTWYGVACDTQGLVSRIELVDHLLTGYIPTELKLLNSGPIKVIDFTDNGGLGQGGFPSVFSEFDSLSKSILGLNV